jgi:hypothetical protein
MKSRTFASAVFLVAALLAPNGHVEACGPWFEPEVFVDKSGPDDLPAFADGHLGILQAGFDSNEYAVAYRYLNGGKLSSVERASYVPPATQPGTVTDYRHMNPDEIYEAQEAAKKAHRSEEPAGQWLLARAKYAPAFPPDRQKTFFPTDYDGAIVFDQNYLNCPDGAFANAVLTLEKRASAWGAHSPALDDWIHAQDAVFSNCASKSAAMPAPAPSGSPVLLTADRAYQIASATLYAKQFHEAARQFAAIAADHNSPWSSWGEYLAARATVREAFAKGAATDPYSGDLATYDTDIMKRAQQMLESILAQPNATPTRTIIQKELNFIRIRTETEKRAAEICAALSGPAPDSNFSNDLKDLSWILSKQIKVEDPAPLMEWIGAWRGSGNGATAYTEWQQTHSLPWLVLAMTKAETSDAFAPALIEEAAKIAPASPAYDSAFFHRVRLLTPFHRADEARTLLDARLPSMRQEGPGSTLNALLGERLVVARDFKEFLIYAPRTALRTGSEGAWNLQNLCNERAHALNAEADCPDLKKPLQFDEDAVAVLNRHTPLAQLIEASTSASLPANLRQDLTIVAWTRAILLEDATSAAKLAPRLPKTIHDTAGNSTEFPADLAILRNSGIRPYLEPGISRVASYNVFDELHDNWWCQPWDHRKTSDVGPATLAFPAFISSQQEALASAEYHRLQQLPDSVALVGQRVLAYANAHPDDPRIPEALALVVRAGHYACQTWNPNGSGDNKSEYTPVSKAAFLLLHHRYPKSPWALKTRYYY